MENLLALFIVALAGSVLVDGQMATKEGIQQNFLTAHLTGSVPTARKRNGSSGRDSAVTKEI